jgi:hypothetical protein
VRRQPDGAHARRPTTQGLGDLIGTVEADFQATTSTKGRPALAQLVADFTTLKTGAEAHLLEEEQVPLPLMRAHFSAEEFEPIKQKMLAPLTKYDLAWFLRPFPDDEARLEWMRRVAGYPPAVVALVVLPACHDYERRIMAPMRALIAGATEAPPPPPDAGHSCPVM